MGDISHDRNIYLKWLESNPQLELCDIFSAKRYGSCVSVNKWVPQTRNLDHHESMIYNHQMFSQICNHLLTINHESALENLKPPDV